MRPADPFYLADRAFVLNTCITALAMIWFAIIEQPYVVFLLAVLWIFSGFIWAEWKNG